MKKKNYKHLTKNEYNAIKSMLNYGLKGSAITQALGRSGATISTIKKSVDFKDYQNIVRNYAENRKKYLAAKIELEAPVELTPEVVPEGTPAEPTVSGDLAGDVLKVLENLNTMLTHLTEVMEALDGRIAWVEDNVKVQPGRRFHLSAKA